MKAIRAAIALTLLLTIPASVPASAQGVRIGPGGVTVDLDRDRGLRFDRGFDRRRDFNRRRGFRHGFERCRTIVERRRNRSGELVTRRNRICR